METLSIKRPRPDFRERMNRIGDLSWFQGPLLTLYEDMQNGFLYLFDWVDRDSQMNRWLIYRAYPADLIAFMDGRKSLSAMFDSRKDSSLLIADIVDVAEWSVYEIEDLPESYHPVESNYFDSADCPDVLKIRNCLYRRVYSNRNNELPVTVVGYIDIFYKYTVANKLLGQALHIEKSTISFRCEIPSKAEVQASSFENTLIPQVTFDNTARLLKRNTYKYAGHDQRVS